MTELSKDPHEVLDLTRQLGREPNIPTALHIMQWELGDLAKSTTYMRWHPDLANAYKVEAKHALADLVFQAEVVAQLLGTDLRESFNFGLEVVKERVDDKERKIGRFKSYEGERKVEEQG